MQRALLLGTWLLCFAQILGVRKETSPGQTDRVQECFSSSSVAWIACGIRLRVIQSLLVRGCQAAVVFWSLLSSARGMQQFSLLRTERMKLLGPVQALLDEM